VASISVDQHVGGRLGEQGAGAGGRANRREEHAAGPRRRYGVVEADPDLEAGGRGRLRVVRDLAAADRAVRQDDDVRLFRLDPGRPPVDLDDAAGDTIRPRGLDRDPVVGPVGVVEIDGDAEEDVEDHAAQGDAEHDADDAGRRPEARDRVTEHEGDDRGGGDRVDQGGAEVLEQRGHRAPDRAHHQAVPHEHDDRPVQQKCPGDPDGEGEGGTCGNSRVRLRTEDGASEHGHDEEQEGRGETPRLGQHGAGA
jgi:hypothetical protein